MSLQIFLSRGWQVCKCFLNSLTVLINDKQECNFVKPSILTVQEPKNRSLTSSYGPDLCAVAFPTSSRNLCIVMLHASEASSGKNVWHSSTLRIRT